jgi:peptidoglycan/LPS O-acetylase OafA/YrhL
MQVVLQNTSEMKIENSRSGINVIEFSAPAVKEKGFWALNWLRFVLAAYLVLFHTLRIYYPSIENSWVTSVLSLGNMATSVFFVLSGFLLTHAYVVMKNGRAINRRNFVIARFSTLYPLHIVGLLLALSPVAVTLFTRGGIPVVVDMMNVQTRMLGQWEVALALFMGFTLLNAWNPFYMVFNGPSWSLSALGFYYLLFPAAAAKIYRMKAPKIALVLLCILFMLPGAVADLLHRTDVFTVGLLHRNPIIRLPLFLAGIVLCVIFARGPKFASTWQRISASVLIIATVLLATVLHHRGIDLHIIQNGLYFPASLAIIWLCISTKWLPHSKIRFWGDRLGAASLPLFLLHVPLFILFRKAEQVIQVWASTSGGFTSVLTAAREAEQTIFLFPLYLILLIAVCLVVQERFVTPLQKAIRNSFSDRGRPDASTVVPPRKQATGTC